MKKNHIFIIFAILGGLNILAWIAVFNLSQTGFLEVTFFDVGQGDAIFIESSAGHQILIDGGPSSIILEKLGEEIPYWDRTIDLIILTHPERDHLAGLIEVLKKYKVENILWTGVTRDTAEYKEWLKLIKEEEANIFIARKGQKIKAATMVLEVLYPFENLAGKEFKDSNDTSIVNRLIDNENSFIFTGDISKSVERALMIGENSSLNSNVLKIAHHGSKTSSLDEFIERVSPQVVVISVGENNSYGHPHQEVLDILNKYDINILRTDIDGDIKIISNGKKYEVSNFQNEN